MVDLEDELHGPRQHVLQQGNRPLLQRLRQNGMVRVGEQAHSDVPGIVPLQTLKGQLIEGWRRLREGGRVGGGREGGRQAGVVGGSVSERVGIT